MLLLRLWPTICWPHNISCVLVCCKYAQHFRSYMVCWDFGCSCAALPQYCRLLGIRMFLCRELLEILMFLREGGPGLPSFQTFSYRATNLSFSSIRSRT